MTLLIKRAKIVGGNRRFNDLKDIFVSGDRISAIGDFPAKAADVTVDARGAYCAPGFIDVNTDSDHYLSLFEYPDQADFIQQGVTTIIGGMCGASLAPLLYGSLESVQKWGDITKVNVDWRTLNEFLRTVERLPLAVNFGTLVGHSTIRRALVGESLRDLSKSELDVFEKTLREACAEGAFGLSTGLEYVHSFRTPYAEIRRLCEAVKTCGGVYATHLRKIGAELPVSIKETLRVMEEANVKTLISHFTPLQGSESAYEEALATIESLSSRAWVKFDIYPSDTSVLAIYMFLPLWARNGGRETMLANVKDEWLRTRIEHDLPDITPDEFVVAQAPGNEFLVGKSLKDVANFYDLANYKAALRKLMEATALKAIVFYRNINTALIERAVRSPRSFIASNAASFPDTPRVLKPERAKSTFTTYLEMTRENMSLEDAVQKITIEPAHYFGISGRGEVREGAYADLAVFRMAGGNAAGSVHVEMRYVIVNGRIALEEGQFRGVRAGAVLRHST